MAVGGTTAGNRLERAVFGFDARTDNTGVQWLFAMPTEFADRNDHLVRAGILDDIALVDCRRIPVEALGAIEAATLLPPFVAAFAVPAAGVLRTRVVVVAVRISFTASR